MVQRAHLKHSQKGIHLPLVVSQWDLFFITVCLRLGYSSLMLGYSSVLCVEYVGICVCLYIYIYIFIYI